MSTSHPPSAHPDSAVRAIDELLQNAGLVRNLQGNAAGVTHRLRSNRQRLDRAHLEDLSQLAPPPRVGANGVHWLPVAAWEKQKSLGWLWHGFSTRQGGLSRAYTSTDAPGELNLGFTVSDPRENVLANRRLLAAAVTSDPATPLIALRQIHSSLLVVIRSEGHSSPNPALADGSVSPASKGDGILTDLPGVLLGIQTADCIPVLVADRKRRVVAAFHAGWRGTVQRIVENGIGRMRLEFGSRPQDLVAAIGPGIGACCYAVGEDLLSSFESQFSYARELFREVDSQDALRNKYPMLFLTQRAPGHSPVGPNLHLNLQEANRRQLIDAGLKPGSIQLVGGCTSCQTSLFFSHRASGGHAGRMLSVIGIRA